VRGERNTKSTWVASEFASYGLRIALRAALRFAVETATLQIVSARSGTDLALDVPLMVRIASGDSGALGELYDRYSEVAFAVALRILHAAPEAEDIVQDVFVELWRKAGAFDRDRGSVRTWLLLMVRSRALDRKRSPAFAKSVSLDCMPDLFSCTEPLLDHPRVAGLLEQLPAVQREVLELGYFDGLSSSEIAGRLSIPLGTVKSRVAAALANLRSAVADAASGVGVTP
jgi:RNA polymerase sigma-70 factor, ECF subfamily